MSVFRPKSLGRRARIAALLALLLLSSLTGYAGARQMMFPCFGTIDDVDPFIGYTQDLGYFGLTTFQMTCLPTLLPSAMNPCSFCVTQIFKSQEGIGQPYYANGTTTTNVGTICGHQEYGSAAIKANYTNTNTQTGHTYRVAIQRGPCSQNGEILYDQTVTAP